MNTFKINPGLFFLIEVAFFLLVIILFALSGKAAAQNNLQSGENIVLQKDQVIDKDYFAGGESVTIAGTINGDAYIGAGKVTVDGTINGDLITGGGDVVINGTVAQDLRAAGGNITVTGQIGRNTTVLGGNINFTNSSRVTGSITGVGGNLNIYAPIGKDIYLGAGEVTIGNSVGGDINAGVGNLTLSSNANVSGNINYVSEKTANVLPGASISGTLNQTLPPVNEREAQKTGEAVAGGFSIFFKAITFVSLLIIGFILIKLFPKFSLQTAQTFGSNFWTSLVVGILAIIIVPVGFILLLITVIGIPLAFILVFGFLLTVYISKVFVSIWLGNFIGGKLSQKWNLYISFLVGIISLTLLSFIPVLGIFISMITGIVGLGALLASKRNFYLKLKSSL